MNIPKLATYIAAAAFGFLALGTTSLAQAPTAPTPEASSAKPGDGQTEAVIHKETRLVLVDTVVTDKKGKYVRDLTQKDFKVFEDNKEQPVVSFSAESDASAPNRFRRVAPRPSLSMPTPARIT